MEASVAIQSLPGVSDDEELCRIVDEVIAYIRAGAPSVAAYIKVSYKPEGEVLSIEKKIGKYQG